MFRRALEMGVCNGPGALRTPCFLPLGALQAASHSSILPPQACNKILCSAWSPQPVSITCSHNNALQQKRYFSNVKVESVAQKKANMEREQKIFVKQMLILVIVVNIVLSGSQWYKQRAHGNAQALRKLEQEAMKKLQLASPDFRCYYTAGQFKYFRCHEISMWSQTGNKFNPDEVDPDEIRELAKKKKKKKEKLGGLDKNTARGSLRELEPEEEGTLDLSTHRGTNMKPDYVDSAEAIAARDTSKTVDSLDDQKKVVPELSEAREKEYARKVVRKKNRDKHFTEYVSNTERDIAHCKKLDQLLIACRDELYDMTPKKTPCMHTLPWPFEKEEFPIEWDQDKADHAADLADPNKVTMESSLFRRPKWYKASKYVEKGPTALIPGSGLDD